MVIVNPENGNVEVAKAFDTYKSGGHFQAFVDLITAFPFSRVLTPSIGMEAVRFLYLLRILRLEKAFLMFDSKVFQRQLKQL